MSMTCSNLLFTVSIVNLKHVFVFWVVGISSTCSDEIIPHSELHVLQRDVFSSNTCLNKKSVKTYLLLNYSFRWCSSKIYIQLIFSAITKFDLSFMVVKNVHRI